MDFAKNPDWKMTVSHYLQKKCEGYKRFDGDLIFHKKSIEGKIIFWLNDFTSDPSKFPMPVDEAGFPEGRKKFILHTIRERDPQVIKEAKKEFKKGHNGKLFCEVCGFNFEDVYGTHGKDYIEGHHSFPVSEMGETHKTNPDDIIMVCSNCHRMLHRKRPWITKDKLKSLLKK